MPKNLSKKCKLKGCEDIHEALGFCKKHVAQFRRKGYASLETRLSPNPYKIENSICYIGLRNNVGRVVDYALIDKEDIDKVKDTRWYKKEDGYAYGLLRGKRHYLHRMIMGEPENKEINHWNHNKLDCRKENLSICSRLENSAYRRRGSKMYKGVYYRSDCKKPWTSRIGISGGYIILGQFSTAEEAAYIYDQVAVQLFGNYALTNLEVV